MKNKILIIDSNTQIRKSVRLSLESDGFCVFEASDKKTAVKIAASEKPNLITLDIMMPEIDGFEIAKSLKENSETTHIPILILSVVNKDKDQYIQGIADYLSKPLNSQALSEKIKSILDKMDINNKHVLVIDDEPDIVDIITLSLKNAGFAITSASNGEEALEKLKTCNPNVIITDINMPKLNGFELIERIKKEPAWDKIPIVVLTGNFISPENKERGLKLGASKYLTKPFTIENLVYEIEETICKA